MLNEGIFNILFVSCFLSTISTSIPICLKWSQRNNKLRFVCHVDGLHLPITLKDPSNTETAFCLPTFIKSNCYNHATSVSVTQDFSKNDTFFAVDTDAYSNINGEWTCEHGAYGDSASVIVQICNSCNQGTVHLNVYYWLLYGFGAVYWIIAGLDIYKIISGSKDHSFWRTLNESSWMKPVVNKINKKCLLFAGSAFVFFIPVFQMTLGFVYHSNQVEDTLGGEIGFALLGALNAVFSSYCSVTLKDLPHLSSNTNDDITDLVKQQDESDPCSKPQEPTIGNIEEDTAL